MFWAILNNFDFLPQAPPPPPLTITTENEKTTDLAWHKLGPKIFLKVFFKFFSSINENLSH